MVENVVYYWSEPLQKDGLCRGLFTAVSNGGLVMSGIGKKEEYLQDLTCLVKRYLTGYTLSEERSPNLAIIGEIREYFEGKRQEFTVDLLLLGTEFQLKVWKALGDIPYGQTCSYSDLASVVECPQGQRAIGSANNKNPLGIVIPCHRVIGKNGSLTGYAGGLEIKNMLLRLERARKKG